MTRVTARRGWDFEAGDEIVPGRFVEKRLGGGRLTEAYLASGPSLTDPVVVKVLRPHHRTDRGRRKLERERAVLADLDHPSIPRLVGGSMTSPRPHLVLEFIPGPRLSSVLRRRGPLPLEAGIDLAHHLGAALDHIHRRGYLHLDVKPSNTVLGTPPHLIDLSVARTLDAAQALRSNVGTDAYIAPEQCDPRAGVPVGGAADVWGLGATLWEALTGRRPFPEQEGERFPQLRGELVAADPLPRHVAEALAACLRRDPEQRPHPAELASRLAGGALSG